MAQIICFSSQKGGPGKTTLTVLAATQLANMGKNVLVLDADFPQHNFCGHRQRDLADLQRNDEQKRELKEILKDLPIQPYPVMASRVSELGNVLPKLKTTQKYDYIFVDLPGTLNVEGIQTAFTAVDLVITPAELEFKSIVTAMETVDFIRGLDNPTQFGWIWTKIKSKYRKAFKVEIEKAVQNELQSHILTYFLPDSAVISHQLNTIRPANSKFKIHDLVEEIIHLLATKKHGEVR